MAKWEIMSDPHTGCAGIPLQDVYEDPKWGSKTSTHTVMHPDTIHSKVERLVDPKDAKKVHDQGDHPIATSTTPTKQSNKSNKHQQQQQQQQLH